MAGRGGGQAGCRHHRNGAGNDLSAARCARRRHPGVPRDGTGDGGADRRAPEGAGAGTRDGRALASATIALTQAVENARGKLAEAAELAARRDGEGSAAARALTEGVAALKAQGEALDKRLSAAGKQTAAAAEGMHEMKQAATVLESRLRTLGKDIVGVSRRLRWRPWLMGLAIGAASFVFFVLGAVLPREIDVVSSGDPRLEWNDYVVEHYAPLVGNCASKARLEDRLIACRLEIEPSLDVTVPFYPGGTVRAEPSEGEFDPTTGGRGAWSPPSRA